MNLYRYANADPINWVDRNGLTGESVIPILPGLGGYQPPGPEHPHDSGPNGPGGYNLPDPTPAIPPLIGGAGLLGWLLNEGDDKCIVPGPDHPYNPGQPTGKDGFKPPRNWNGKKTKKNGQWGWMDKNGNHWVPSNPGNAHGGPHWDVQKPGGGYVNVFPGGTAR